MKGSWGDSEYERELENNRNGKIGSSVGCIFKNGKGMNTFTDRKIHMKMKGFLDHNGIKVESNKEVSGKISNIFKLNQKHVSNHESKRKSQGY